MTAKPNIKSRNTAPLDALLDIATIDFGEDFFALKMRVLDWVDALTIHANHIIDDIVLPDRAGFCFPKYKLSFGKETHIHDYSIALDRGHIYRISRLETEILGKLIAKKTGLEVRLPTLQEFYDFAYSHADIYCTIAPPLGIYVSNIILKTGHTIEKPTLATIDRKMCFVGVKVKAEFVYDPVDLFLHRIFGTKLEPIITNTLSIAGHFKIRKNMGVSGRYILPEHYENGMTAVAAVFYPANRRNNNEFRVQSTDPFKWVENYCAGFIVGENTDWPY